VSCRTIFRRPLTKTAVRSSTPPTSVHPPTPLVAFSPLARNIHGLRLRSLFPPAHIFTQRPSLLFLSSFLCSFCDAEQPRPSFTGSLSTADFTHLASCATNISSSVPATILALGAPRYTTNIHARIAAVPQILNCPAFTPSFFPDSLTCLISSSPRLCWLWWRLEYWHKLLLRAAMATCVLQIYRVVRVRPQPRTDLQKAR
jgi:hypothetical protein